jgi:hypothetical protein
MENSPKKDTKKIYILLAVIVVLVGTNIFLWMQKDKTEVKYVQTTDEKAKLQTQLNELEIELRETTANMDSLNSDLQAKDTELKAKVAELQASLRKGNLSAGQLEKARNEIDQLRYYIKKYQGEINDLKKENELLLTENTGLKQTVEQEQKKSSELTDQNISLSNKVTVASLLRTSTITSKGIRVRSNGKEVETDRAKNVDKIKVTFTITDNRVANTGNRDFFLRIVNPDGKAEVVTDASESNFRADGEDLKYSAKINASFDNNTTQVYTLYWNKASTINPGTYKIILYADGNSIGSSTLVLK